MNTEVVDQFYSSFARRDGEAMAACYVRATAQTNLSKFQAEHR